MRIRLTRRHLATALLVAVGGGAGIFWFRPDATRVELALPPAGDPNHPTFEIFQALCSIVFAREDLDPTLTQRMYEVFMDEPRGPRHIGRTYARLREAIARQAWNPQERRAAPVARLDADERWFVSHLVTTWYLGIYYHMERPTQLITYEDALMYDAMRGLIPKPFFESVGYGRWAELPPGAERRQ